MKAFIVLAVLSCVVLVSEARMSAFSCTDCFAYETGPFCMSNGYVACNNCKRDQLMCDDSSITVTSSNSDCNQACTNPAELDEVKK